MKELLSPEGPVYSWLDKLGQMILLSLLWLVGCLPVVTIAASSTALYYAVMKSIRRGTGDAVKEFLRSYKMNLKRGIPITLIALVLGAGTSLNVRLSLAGQLPGNVLPVANGILLAVLVMMLVYVCPVMSRFDMKAKNVWKLSFVMAVRFLPFTIALAAGLAAVVYLQFYILPMPTILILPSAWCFVTTFPVEKALRKYMPEKKPEDDAWYYE